MANRKIDMREIRQIIRLFTEGISKHHISRQLGLSRNTVKKYIGLFEQHRLTYEKLSELEDKDLDDLFEEISILPIPEKSKNLVLDFPYISKELKRVGVTHYLLWSEYKYKCPSGYVLIILKIKHW